MTHLRPFSLLLVLTLLASCGDSGTTGDGGTQADSSVPPMPPSSAERPADYIRNEGFLRLIVELDTVAGLSPRAGVTADVTDVLGDVVDKPNGISFVTDDTDVPSADDYNNGDGVWTFAELQDLANEQSSLELVNGEIAMLTMWVDGEYEDANVLGVAWGQRFIAMFGERIAQTCNVPPIQAVLCRLAEATIWTHEIGHVIGLVDNGVPMVNDHRDAEHGRHDVSDESVMYWAYEGVGVMDVLQSRLLGNNEEVIPWGAECLNDLAAVRGN